jgi:hypothetical protein
MAACNYNIYCNNLLVQISLPTKKQLLNCRHSAAVGRLQSVGYKLYVDIVNKTDRLYTCATDSGSEQ